MLVSARPRERDRRVDAGHCRATRSNPPASGDGTPFTGAARGLLERIRNRIDDGLVAQAETEPAAWLAGERQGVLPGEICETD